MRLTSLAWTTFAAASLTAAVFGQDPQSAVAPPEVRSFTPPTLQRLPPVDPPSEVPPLEVEPILTAPTKTDTPAISSPAGFGMGGPGTGGPGMGQPGYGAAWYPSCPTSGGEDFGLIRQNLSAAIPVWRNGGDMILFSAGVRNTLFFTDAMLPNFQQPFPDELWNVRFGTNYMHKFDNGWSGMVGINFGSASDKPFHSIEEMNVGFLSSLQIPVQNDRDAWLLSLFYSPVGNLNFPIPGIAYLWRPSDALRVSLGIPFFLMWRPIEDLTINISFMPLTTVNARATYRLVGDVFIFTGFESLQETYLLADRENVHDRFMGFEKRLLGGIRWDLWQYVAWDIQAGYAFDRYYGVGQNQIGHLNDQLNIASGAFLSTNVNIRF